LGFLPSLLPPYVDYFKILFFNHQSFPLQVERALLMHSTGYFIQDDHSFSEQSWGTRTAIYVKLANDLSDLQWKVIYEAMHSAEVTQERISRLSRPVENWTDNPDNYHVVASDPPDTEEQLEEEYIDAF
jgi:hypothetical protein